MPNIFRRGRPIRSSNEVQTLYTDGARRPVSATSAVTSKVKSQGRKSRAPVYLTEMNDPASASTSRSHLRSAARGNLAVPRSRTTTYGQRSFSVSGPSLWNSLPLSVRDPSLTLTMTQFCTHLKTFMFRRTYCT